MRSVLAFLLCLFVVHIGHAETRTRSSTTAASPRRYTRVADWARANGFDLRWTRRDETFQLSNREKRINLGIDSREALIEGVQVKLLFPIVSQDGAPWISQLDIQHTLQPLINPQKPRTPVKTIVLDPGHGGKDPGYQVGSKQEKQFTLLFAQELRDQLSHAGFKVSLTRTTDSYIDLPVRPDIAKRRGADLFLSLHFNAFPKKTVSGAEVYCLTPAGAPSTNARGEGGGAGWFAGNRFNDQNLLLAYQIQKTLGSMGIEDRGVHRARFAVLRDAEMPAVLVEAGFMSHPVEGPKIFNADYRKRLAGAVVTAVKAYGGSPPPKSRGK